MNVVNEQITLLNEAINSILNQFTFCRELMELKWMLNEVIITVEWENETEIKQIKSMNEMNLF